jgi:hypothetical protein
MYGEFGYAAADVHLFHELSCVESYVDIPLHTRQHVKHILDDDQLMIETYWSDFKCFNV